MQFKRLFFFKEVLGAGMAWNDRSFFYWIYQVSDAAAMDMSELDGSKENSLSVSLFVHADDVQDDLDDDLKEAAADVWELPLYCASR